MRQALTLLPDRDREILTLVAWEDLTPAQTAQVIGVPASSARTRLQRARTRLRRILDADLTDEPGVLRTAPTLHVPTP